MFCVCSFFVGGSILLVSIVGTWKEPYSWFGSSGALRTPTELRFLTAVGQGRHLHFKPSVDLVNISVDAMALAIYYTVEVLAVAGGFLADTGEVRSIDMRECYCGQVLAFVGGEQRRELADISRLRQFRASGLFTGEYRSLD